ncbi:hypothetical protein AN1605.2 [Aspergillus nidulans FGSC A4]|uniref:Uncharacterized protein n=1 Tax=Emericella nidulans (strain FGSC A4 / ATCC 38163 / CBS 112.46 / NRRL 194 / M139) TaxID=227321 RepID=Q5BCX5_EMENI|nr:hypothetical protein [Aspergillus nidulans FGSC A4]EAA64725.1 hypothetical protein AN1605.2 [Aspergillus nidulans FGSC A4]CBF85208.1 TPA: hypothetical protein ANIA_01605 [Aspergillus nidulans FGSC A4]|eukprot:XP_659209.1 hypothetical protein AN1605.2 [Aspergillus nidulans FGSC A4]
MERPAFLLPTATSHPTKPNTRIPPILAAGKATSLSPNSTTAAEPPFSRIATISRQKLSAEAARGDPDLRRCLGHHRLLARSLYEAKQGMKRYLEEVLESESEDDEDIYGEYEFGKGEVLLQEDELVDDEDDDDDDELYDDDLEDEDDDEDIDDECPTVEEEEVVAPPASITVSPDPAADSAPAPNPDTSVKDQFSAPVPQSVPASMVPCSNSSTAPGPVWVKEKIVGAVRGLVRRRNSTSLSPSPGPSPSTPPPTASPPEAASKSEAQSALAHMAANNASCSQIPVYIHIHEHLSKPARRLERSQSQSQLQSRSQGHGRFITMRGRQYAQRLGLKVAAAVPVTT